jgi:hypothetical protein
MLRREAFVSTSDPAAEEQYGRQLKFLRAGLFRTLRRLQQKDRGPVGARPGRRAEKAGHKNRRPERHFNRCQTGTQICTSIGAKETSRTAAGPTEKFPSW